jgi:hypothetical protein
MEKDRREQMISVVQKLMTLAGDSRTPIHEAENAQEKANAIMRKYKIAWAEAQLKEGATINKVDVNSMEMECFYQGGTDWETFLANSIALTFDCKMIYSTNFITKDRKVSFVGIEEDLLNCAYFFDYLQFKIAGMVKAEYPKGGVKTKNSFCRGVTSRIDGRLKKMYKKVEESLPENCMQLVVCKKGAVMEKFRELFPRVGIGHSGAKLDYAAYSNGRVKGKNVALSKGVEGNKSNGTTGEIAA